MNWGVLGCARIAESSMIPAILSIPENKLVAVASRSQQSADAFAQKFNVTGIEGYEELLKQEDIQAVYIPLPNNMHFEWVMKALEYNKHVLVEKPASVNLKEALAIVELAKNKGLTVVENFLFPHHSQQQYVKGLIANNEIGEIRCFRSSFGFPPFDKEKNIRYKKELGGGSLLDSGAYVLRASNFMMGDGFEVKAAHLHINPEYGVDWFGGAFLVNAERGIFSEVAFGFDNYYQCSYEIWGSKGKIIATRAFTAKPGFAPAIILEKDGQTNEIVLPADDQYKNILVYFNQLVKDRNIPGELKNLVEQARLIEQVNLISAI